jgi:hypothetical protein
MITRWSSPVAWGHRKAYSVLEARPGRSRGLTVQRLLPAIGIVTVAIILVAVNELTDLTFIQDYALILIIAGMFLGAGLARLGSKSRG